MVAADLFADDVAEARALSADVWEVTTKSGRRLVAKRVPRQEQRTWRPGRPWAELVALDLLAAAGGPVPRLVAADLERGWLALEFVEGATFAALRSDPDGHIFRRLVEAVVAVERLLGEDVEAIRPFLVADDTGREALMRRVGDVLLPDARAAWEALVREAFADPACSALGSLDLQPGNAIARPDGVVLIDFATLGWEDRERRLVAYTHRARPAPGTLLGPAAYAAYGESFGPRAMLRLAAYDFAFALELLRLSGDGPGGDAAAAGAARELWRRHRFDDDRLDAVAAGVDWARLKDVGRASGMHH